MARYVDFVKELLVFQVRLSCRETASCEYSQDAVANVAMNTLRPLILVPLTAWSFFPNR